MKNIFKIFATIAASAALFSCQKTEPVFQIENDVLSVDCTEQNVQQFIKCSGTWNVDCSEVDWITVTPESGTGNGVDFDSYTLNIEYNSGAERTGTYYVISNGQKLSVAVTQAACAFAYGDLKLIGAFAAGEECNATIKVPYECASGKETVTFTGSVTSETVTGITVPEYVCNTFAKGKGEVEVPVTGVPKGAGAIEIELFADGKSIGTISKTVSADPNLPEGLTASWNFYHDIDPVLPKTTADGTPSFETSKYNYSWIAGNSVVDPATLTVHPHRVATTSGNENAYLTVVGNNITNWSYNPGIQAQGVLKEDYFLCVLPVRNVKSTHKISVEASVAGAGSASGYYVMEYSTDAVTWIQAPNAETIRVENTNTGEVITGPVHFYVWKPADGNAPNSSTTRKTYDKATDESYKKYTFALEGINEIADGNFYVRLRCNLDLRINYSATTTYANAGWVDLKGIEIKMIEE